MLFEYISHSSLIGCAVWYLGLSYWTWVASLTGYYECSFSIHFHRLHSAATYGRESNLQGIMVKRERYWIPTHFTQIRARRMESWHDTGLSAFQDSGTEHSTRPKMRTPAGNSAGNSAGTSSPTAQPIFTEAKFVFDVMDSFRTSFQWEVSGDEGRRSLTTAPSVA